MAEPTRRRVGLVQQEWLRQLVEAVLAVLPKRPD
jgi:hypothetical protein